MTAIETDDLVIVACETPPLVNGEVARVVGRSNREAIVLGLESRERVIVPVDSLIALEDAYEDCSLYLEIHDYVYEEDE